MNNNLKDFINSFKKEHEDYLAERLAREENILGYKLNTSGFDRVRDLIGEMTEDDFTLLYKKRQDTLK